MTIVLKNTNLEILCHKNDTVKELPLFKDCARVEEIKSLVLIGLGIPETL